MSTLFSSFPWSKRTPLLASADHSKRLAVGDRSPALLRASGHISVSVGGWLIATAPQRLWGDAAASIRLTVLTDGGNPPPEGRMRPGTAVFGPEYPAADRPLGNSVGAIGWPLGAAPRLVGRPERSGVGSPSPQLRYRDPPLRGLPAATLGETLGTRVGFRVVTWLILPVVICLSQRLSHACLSISNYTVKLRMAH